MTGWRRPLLVVGALAGVIFLATVALGSQASRVRQSYVDAVSDEWGGVVPHSDWNPHQQAQALRMLAVLLPYSLLTLPARAADILMGIGDRVAPWSVEWLLLLAASSLIWALVLYSAWSGCQALWRRREGT